MFCRYCGSHIAEDSMFCARCGKRLGKRPHPRLEKAARVLRLNTPYPYFVVLLAGFAVWLLGRSEPRVDYSNLKLTLSVERNLDHPEEALFQQSFSLHIENTGTGPVRRIPIELSAAIEPEKPAEVLANFRGRQLPIMQSGKPLPLEVVLTDEVLPGAKRHFALGGSIQAAPPFKVTYQIRDRYSETLLASYAVER
jgi:hypothetical protein